MATKKTTKASVKREVRRAEKEAENLAEKEERMAIKDLRNVMDDDSGGSTPVPAAPVPVTPSYETIEDEMYERRPDTFRRRAVDEEVNDYGVVVYPFTYIKDGVDRTSRVVKMIYKEEQLRVLSGDQNGWTEVESLDEEPIRGFVKTAFIARSEG